MSVLAAAAVCVQCGKKPGTRDCVQCEQTYCDACSEAAHEAGDTVQARARAADYAVAAVRQFMLNLRAAGSAGRMSGGRYGEGGNSGQSREQKRSLTTSENLNHTTAEEDT